MTLINLHSARVSIFSTLIPACPVNKSVGFIYFFIENEPFQEKRLKLLNVQMTVLKFGESNTKRDKLIC